jgi:DNA-binding NarL/FixJ family response regulator
MSVTIVLADDHDIVRQGLRLLLEEQADFRERRCQPLSISWWWTTTPMTRN